MKVLAAILLLTVTAFAAPAPWTPANFRGLIVGKAHRAEALRTLGAPTGLAETTRATSLSDSTAPV